jgi:hypothetical protein
MARRQVVPASGLEVLLPLVGKWHTEGEQLEGPLGPAAPFVAVETFEWLAGGHFLVHHLEGRFGRQPSACIEIMGMKASGQIYVHSFYNDGNSNTWEVEAKGSNLVLSGEWAAGGGQSFQVRYIMSFTDAGNTLEGKWEQSRDGRIWKPFLDARSTRAQPLPTASIGL